MNITKYPFLAAMPISETYNTKDINILWKIACYETSLLICEGLDID